MESGEIDQVFESWSRQDFISSFSLYISNFRNIFLKRRSHHFMISEFVIPLFRDFFGKFFFLGNFLGKFFWKFFFLEMMVIKVAYACKKYLHII